MGVVLLMLGVAVLAGGAIYVATSKRQAEKPDFSTGIHLAPGYSSGRLKGGAGLVGGDERSGLNHGSPPDLGVFDMIRYVDAASTGGRVLPGDVDVLIWDSDPESSGSYDTQPEYEMYAAHATSVLPKEPYYTILATDLDKRAGGEDRLRVRTPDGRVHWRTRERGKEWPSD